MTGKIPMNILSMTSKKRSAKLRRFQSRGLRLQRFRSLRMPSLSSPNAELGKRALDPLPLPPATESSGRLKMTAFRRKGQPRVGRAQEVKERYTYPSRPQESTVLAMNPQVSAESESFYRKAGWAAITSGVIGIVAYGLLMTAVKTRTGWIDERAVLFFKAHDIGTIFQFLLLAIVPLGLQKLSRKTPPGMSKATLATGVGAILFVALLLLLGIARIVSDGFYMFPQG